MAKPSVLIVEDDPAWQDIFTEISDDAGFKPVTASTYREALLALERQTFALAVLDMSLSELYHDNRDGLKVLRKIAALPEKLPAIVVTGYATVDLAIETLVDLNAVNFFQKNDFDRRKFFYTLKKEAVVKKEVPFTSTHLPAGFIQRLLPQVLAVLSGRELEVLYFLSQGWTNKEIAAELTVSVNTIKKHTQSIFTKLNVTNRAAAVAQALGGEK